MIDLCELVTDGSHHSPPSQVEGYYMASVKDMGAYKFIYSDCRKISEEDYDKLVKSGCSPKNEDILIAKDGSPLSNIFIYQEEYPMVLLSSIAIIRANKNKILPEFLKYYLENPSIKKYIQTTYTSGSVIPRIILKDFKKFPINYPDIANQKKIIGVLKSIDEKIAINEEINKNLEQLLHTIFNYWFISFGKFENSNFTKTFLGDIPEGWNCGVLRDLLILTKNPIKSNETNGLPYLPIDIIPMNSLGISELKSDDEANSSLITFDKNDILIGAMRVYFHRVVISPCSGVTRSTCFVLKPKKEEYLSYLLLLCNLDQTIQYAQNTSKGTTMPYAVWDNGLGDMDIIIPPENVLKEFHELVFPIIEKIRDSYNEINKLQKLRDTLLPKLMSGEIDVSQINCDLKIIIIKFILNPLKYLWRYLNENKDYIQNTKSNETLLKSRPIYKINKFFTKFTSRYRNYRQ
ncbi:restriction endonuclease subunit S [uncultured Methanobrevibacter sp.]|uniref:restriction endonuclease subunit S n=1 Tax=uncultured Methanobrevibacter sp. TaxID=253161 RepID=UPI002626F198|nr:restriction endonuclease subunit S [uncultured Methanobrevibacter sp.]